MTNASQQEDFIEPKRIKRPYGITLAILTGTILYGIWPVMLLFPPLFSTITGNSLGINLIRTPIGWISIALGVVLLLIMIPTLRGRPAWIKWLFIGIIWVSTILRIIESFMRQEVTIGALVVLILIPVYITWYLNRAPARAFYAGH